MDKITPFLWFDNQAEEAMNFYVSIFRNSKTGEIRRWGKGGPGPEGSVISASFELDGRPYIALNGGQHYRLTPAFSMFVSCESQAEVDELWEKLSAGGTPSRCGWLTEKFGLSWQIIPTALGAALGNPDPEKAKRAMQAMLQIVKFDIAALEAAQR